MEQVLFRVHVRLIRMTQMYFNSSSRRIFEKLLLLIAILSLFLLSVLHLTYVSPVLFKSTCLTDENIIIGSKVDLLSIQILQEDYLIGTKSWNSCKSDTCLTTDRHVWNAWGLLRSSAPFQRNNTYVFSVEKGFLLLPSDTLFKHNVSRREVLISSSAACLGPPLSTFLLRHFIGFDTVAKNWVIRKFGGRGYLHNIHAEEIYDLNLAADFVARTGNAGSTGLQKEVSLLGWHQYFAFKVGVVLTTLFLFFTTTTLVSFTLRVTQERMLKFTFLLNYNISHRIPYSKLVVTHLTESLVFVPLMIGVLFFLFEFFLDQFLAFQVLSLVWAAEVYSTITLRTMISMRYFPRVFFAYFSLFHVYFFCFPFGYSYPALVTSVLFLLHAMFCFWNYCELPAFNSGSITALRPRFGVEEVDVPLQRPSTQLPNAPVDAVASFPANPRRHRVLRPTFQRPTSHRVSGTAHQSGESSPARAFSSSPAPNSRDTYSRHVEHSRRIQNQQMAALLGLPVSGIAEVPPDDVGLDLDNMAQAGDGSNQQTDNYISHASSSDSDHQ